MWLKIAIVLLFIGILISLSSGLMFLMKDVNDPKKRLLSSLRTRVILASIMMVLIAYGFYSGQLSNKAPWDTNKQQHSELNKVGDERNQDIFE